MASGNVAWAARATFLFFFFFFFIGAAVCWCRSCAWRRRRRATKTYRRFLLKRASVTFSGRGRPRLGSSASRSRDPWPRLTYRNLQEHHAELAPVFLFTSYENRFRRGLLCVCQVLPLADAGKNEVLSRFRSLQRPAHLAVQRRQRANLVCYRRIAMTAPPRGVAQKDERLSTRMSRHGPLSVRTKSKKNAQCDIAEC